MLNKNLSTKKADSELGQQDYFTTILEDIRDQFQVFKEILLDISYRLDKLN